MLLRISPYMTVGDWAWHVSSSGDVYYGTNGVGISYGRLISPNTGFMSVVASVWCIDESGSAKNYVSINYLSYGSPYTDYDNYTWIVWPDGDVHYISDGYVSFSYGRIYFRRTWYTATLFYPEYWWLRSPGMISFDGYDAWYVTSSGVSAYDSGNNVRDSYGRIYFRRASAASSATLRA